jgi:hypothetical protein
MLYPVLKNTSKYFYYFLFIDRFFITFPEVICVFLVSSLYLDECLHRLQEPFRQHLFLGVVSEK